MSEMTEICLKQTLKQLHDIEGNLNNRVLLVGPDMMAIINAWTGYKILLNNDGNVVAVYDSPFGVLKLKEVKGYGLAWWVE